MNYNFISQNITNKKMTHFYMFLLIMVN